MFNFLKKIKEIYNLEQAQGSINTFIPGVRLFWGEKDVETSPMIYPSGIIIITNGKKVGYFDSKKIIYDKNNFLIVSVSTPFVCSTFASKEDPLLGMFIEINYKDIHELVSSMIECGYNKFNKIENNAGIMPMPIPKDMQKTIERLMQCLISTTESHILGKSLTRELMYHVLKSQHGAKLYSLAIENTSSTQIAKVVDYIRKNYQSKITIKFLANYANMSETTFYRTFKNITGHAPLQYVKKIRLSKARSLIVHNGIKVNIAAYNVGYDNISQFSREFKQFFQITPAKSKGAGYANVDIWK